MPFIGQQPTSGLFIELDSLTASATDQYTLQLNGANYYPESVNNLLVSINGVIQGSNTLSLSGSTLTVGATLSASDVIDFVRVFGNVGTISTPTDGSVTANKIASGAVTDVKIDTMSSSKLTGALPSSVTSSGVYIGGTGSANYLDDYEEGTFTAQISTDTTYVGDTAQLGVYTKIGDICFFQIRFQRTGTLNTGVNARFGLPFTSANNSVQATGSRGSVENIDTAMVGIGGTVASNSAILYLNEMNTATTGFNVDGNDLGTNFQIQIQGFYKTA